MRLLLVSPPATIQTGNKSTSDDWAAQFIALGHSALVVPAYRGETADGLIALHAAKSHESVLAFRAARPRNWIVVALAGTDLYPELSAESLESLQIADRIVVLQERALERVPPGNRSKTRYIPIGVPSLEVEVDPSRWSDPDHFQVAVVGHLRAVKDPFRAAAASRLATKDSRLTIRHAGAIVDEAMSAAVEEEERDNPRYRWLGTLSREEARALIAASDLLVLSSYSEGGSCVLGEALVADTPVIAARNDASVSALGAEYPGLYRAGDTEELAKLLHRAEFDQEFLGLLTEKTRAAAPRCDPELEREAWRLLLAELAPAHSTSPESH